ncbi:hypothetical protein [Kitasatospora sp. NPDC087314]|uniref:hypothetical protein n=1 Tax=Kitasatospora sp. NPDC087314 TaxID=3364068 RepID=UPI00381A585D
MSETNDFPPDLLTLQRSWYAAEAAWASDPSEENRAAFSSVAAELYAHPYWAGVKNRHEAEMKLKQASRPAGESPAP